ncbi:MAG: ferrous iron transporter B [Clostridia bacterium]|nr:ferrous iron transporter B [Clostridia bacterium]
MNIKIALAGNPNSGKTTLFNALTGSNQFVGNWPGVTVEKKEGKLKKYEGVTVTDLPGIYSLSPYTPEEVIARNYLIDERPDAVLNIVDGSNLERNLYLTTQLTELGIPVVVAINMMDVVKKNGDKIDTKELSRRIGCRIVEISALKGKGVDEAAAAAVEAAKGAKTVPLHTFSGPVEHAIAHIEEAVVHGMPEEQQRWYAIKVFERDSKVLERLNIPAETLAHIEKDIASAEKELDDDAESIITNERYVYIGELCRACYKKRDKGRMTVSDKIDRVVTNRWLGLPIFALVMFLVYFLSMAKGAPGTRLTDWMNDGVFGDGWHLLGIGSKAYEEKAGEYEDAINAVSAFYELDTEAEDFDPEAVLAELKSVNGSGSATVTVEDDETLETSEMTVYFDSVPDDAGENVIGMSFKDAVNYLEEKGFEKPDPAEDGVWVPSIPALLDKLLLNEDGSTRVPEWLYGLIQNGIVAGVGAVLGFVPQMLVLFLLLAFLEACGYMARIAFVLDRIFRRFGLSGKSFIPMLIGTGCGIPGVMASRTIENERDRRMTIMTTTFIPCGAKIPFIAMIAGALFGGSALVSVSAYFIGMAAIIISGVMLKKTKMFAGEPAPFVMELPAYHWPTLGSVLRSMWERGWSFIKKAGTIILLSTIVVWFLSYFGVVEGAFRMLSEDELDHSILAAIGGAVAWIFAPLGWGNWQAAVASFTGLVAKENIVGTMGILYGGGELTAWQAIARAFNGVTGYSFLVFNLLCAPCFAAIGAIRREMNSAKWTWFAIGYQCLFAYAIALMINQFGGLFTGSVNVIGLIAAFAILGLMIYMLFIKKYREATTLEKTITVK